MTDTVSHSDPTHSVDPRDPRSLRVKGSGPSRSFALAGVLLPLIATSRHGMLQVGGETAASNDEVSLVRVLPDPATASRRLYATLHEFDEAGLDFILIVMPPPTPEWAAVRDRLTRASQPWPES